MPNNVTATAPLGPMERQGNSAFATSVALLMLRLALGWTFIFHGSQLAFGLFGGPGISDFATMFAKNPLPILPPTAWAILAAYGQLIGGLSILLGLLARLGAINIIIVMLVAISTVHAKNGFSLANQGYEYNINLIAMALALVITGPGIISADAYLFPRNLWAHGPQPLNQPTTRTK